MYIRELDWLRDSAPSFLYKWLFCSLFISGKFPDLTNCRPNGGLFTQYR